MTALPGTPESCWVADAPPTRYPRLTDSIDADVAVIGGGIVGLTSAYLLARAGAAVTLVDAGRIGHGVTGRSTAKVTCQHALAFSVIASQLGMDKAALYAEANRAGVELIVELVQDLGIDCDLERTGAFAYTLRDDRRDALAREAALARSFGIDAEVVDAPPVPFATKGAVMFANQAQFNPAKYLVGLAAAFRRAGGRIVERTRIDDLSHTGKGWRATCGRHRLRAEHAVSATHIPIGSPIDYDELTQPRCHVAMAFRAPRGTLDGMHIDVDQPSHSLRMGRDAEGPLLVVLGPRFPTGHDGNVAQRFMDLARWVEANVPAAGEVAYRWVNEDYDSPDGIPYAGQLDRKAPRLYVATGFNGWGISNGTAAARLIADQVLGARNAWASLYDPERRSRRINDGGDTRSNVSGVEGIRPGEGGVVDFGRKKVAIWKSPRGRVHAFDAACTHKGCTLTWNGALRQWDCPCHGSMFTCKGEVIHGPATEPLKAAKLPGA